MEVCTSQDDIYKLTEYSQKARWETTLRCLWRNCFCDPLHYENFYFDTVYPNNKVYMLENKGMVHLNYYRCRVFNHEMTVPYIVGVATDERYRRQGVMRKLLEQVFADLESERVPLTYLMPANVEYYKPFRFRSVSKKMELDVIGTNVDCSECFRYMSYREFQNQTGSFQVQLLEVVNQWLKQQYDMYAIHDRQYYDLLYAEKSCQSGDITFCFKDTVDIKNLCGVFAYAMGEDMPYVEQLLIKPRMPQSWDGIQRMLCSYFTECDRIRIIKAYPYMFRIVCREAFLDLLGEHVSGLSGKLVKEMSDEQLITALFTEKDNIYFAEIV